ncbi:MAG: hypothetical protein ABFD89_17765 [Bryobacteraceae bacterium]
MKNWKTTLVGIIAGALTILQTSLTAYQDGTKVQWLQVALGIAIMAFGVICKDFNVTGVGDTAKTAAKLTSVGIVALLLGGCGGTLHSTIEKIMVFEQQVHTEQAQILLAANAAIATLPADQQKVALEKLNAANDTLTATLNVKDAALTVALNASDASGINLAQIEQDILAAVNAIVALVQVFGVPEQTARAQASGARLSTARTVVVK